MGISGHKPLLIAALPVVLTACSAFSHSTQHENSFAKYAESVFRRQNELTTRLIMMHEDYSLDGNEKLQHAEQEMNDACYPLNEYADNEMTGQSMGLFFKWQVQASIEKCERKIQKLESLLSKTHH